MHGVWGSRVILQGTAARTRISVWRLKWNRANDNKGLAQGIARAQRQKFRVYHYRCKNDIISALFDGEIMSLDESEGNFMATSSITANFYTDDPKAANKIVHALFSGVKSSSKLPTAANSERKYTPVQERAFWRRFEKVHGLWDVTQKTVLSTIKCLLRCNIFTSVTKQWKEEKRTDWLRGVMMWICHIEAESV